MKTALYFLLAVSLSGQTPAPQPRPTATEAAALDAIAKIVTAGTPGSRRQQTTVIQLKNADVNRIVQLISHPGISVRADAALRVISVQADYSIVPVLEEAIRKMDVAPPAASNIELTVYLVSASVKEGAGQPIPADLAPAVKQVAAVIGDRNYRLIDSLVLRGRDGQGGSASGALPGFGEGANYQFEYNRATASGSSPRLIKIDRISLQVHALRSGNFLQSRINTDLDAKEGQKIVVGKSNADPDTALILVLVAKVVE